MCLWEVTTAQTQPKSDITGACVSKQLESSTENSTNEANQPVVGEEPVFLSSMITPSAVETEQCNDKVENGMHSNWFPLLDPWTLWAKIHMTVAFLWLQNSVYRYIPRKKH